MAQGKGDPLVESQVKEPDELDPFMTMARAGAAVAPSKKGPVQLHHIAAPREYGNTLTKSMIPSLDGPQHVDWAFGATYAAPEDAAVAADEALDDRRWFANRPARRYRARRGGKGAVWLIRRIAQGADADVFLRAAARLAAVPRDNEAEIALLWGRTVDPQLDAHAAIRAARKRR
jgi:hypothetical protein